MKFGYENLDVAKLAKKLITEIYEITKSFPKNEMYGLSSQVRRAAVSVLLNIAEGSSRKGKKDFARFVRISLSSLVEVDCGLKVSNDLNYSKDNDYNEVEPIIKELYFKLIGLEKYLLKQ